MFRFFPIGVVTILRKNLSLLLIQKLKTPTLEPVSTKINQMAIYFSYVSLLIKVPEVRYFWIFLHLVHNNQEFLK
jgi:hypothetical protein